MLLQAWVRIVLQKDRIGVVPSTPPDRVEKICDITANGVR